MDRRTILITGCQTGVGLATAQYFQSQGWSVIATMLWPDRCPELRASENLIVLPLDVENRDSIHSAVRQALQHFNHIDVLFNNAGFAVMGAFESATDEQIRKQFNVNLFGLMDVTRAVLPHMRSRRRGLIINASSSAGRYSWPLLSLYNATKCAVEGFSETLLYELEPLGIGVKIIEFDKVKTAFAQGIIPTTLGEEFGDYAPYTQRVLATIGQWGDDPRQISAQAVAQLVFDAATDGKTQLRYLIGEELIAMVGLKSSLSDEAFTDLVRGRFSG